MTTPTRIGDEHFAIEFLLLPFTGDPTVDAWLEGYLRFVIGGVPIGDFEMDTFLNSAGFYARKLAANRGQRGNETLMRMPGTQVFQILHDALDYKGPLSSEQVDHDWVRYKPLAGFMALELFSGWEAYLLEDSAAARYIWRRSLPGEPVVEYRLRPGHFDDVLEAFAHAVDALYAESQRSQ